VTLSGDGRKLGFAAISVNSQIWLQPVRKEGSPAAPATPLTSDTSRRNSLPVVSPDGSKVAYVSTRRGEEPNVWVMGMDGRNPVQITSDETADHKPTWFPDGRRVAYLSRTAKTNGLWSVDVMTRRQELLFDFTQYQLAREAGGRLAEFQLSPSITQLAYSVIEPPGGRRTIYVTSLDQYAPRAFGSTAGSVGYPAWSPDEKQLAVELKDGSTHAGVIDLATGSFRQLTHDRGQTWVRSWSPDGTRLVVAARRDGLWSLRSIDASSGAQATVLSPSPARVYVRYPEWSPLGNAIVFERGEIRGNIWTLAIGSDVTDTRQ
jgi:Tol biopolymer transport system component